MFLIFIFTLKPIEYFEDRINKYHWSIVNPELRFIKSENTKYQNLALLKFADQYTIFSDGKPIYNIPNTYNAEIFIHLIMVQANKPKSVLIIGNGFNGLIKEVLKYGVEDLDYVEVDPKIINFIRPYLDETERQYLINQFVDVINDDGRNFIQTTDHKYDVILLNIGEPSNAGLNRYYTSEFFQNCYQRLNDNGLIAFSFPSSEDYFGDELKTLDASIYATFKNVFPNNIIVPGTSAIFIGSGSDSFLVTDPDSLSKKYINAKIKSIYFSENLFEQLMPKDRMDFVKNTLENVESPILNSDMNPTSYYFDMILWNKFLKGDSKIFDKIHNLNILELGAMVMIAILIPFLLNIKKNTKRVNVVLNISMLIGGMIGIIISLILILNFQTVFGSIYEMIGGMIAANMLGLAMGTLTINRLKKTVHLQNVLFFILLTIVLFTALIPFILNIIFWIRSIICSFMIIIFYGGLTGSLFGVLNKMYLEKSDKLGNIYSYELFGSAIGSLITSSILIPVYGIEKTCLLLVMILSIVLILDIITFRIIR
jgi:spermidine synthase